MFGLISCVRRWPHTTCIWNIILQVTTSLGHYFIKADRRSDRVLLGYSPTLSKWHRIAFDFLPMQIQPAASAGGLVCLVADYRPFALFVCNPITKVARQLPPRICKRRPRIVCMVVDRLAKTYKIIAAGGYRTDDDRWTTVCGEFPGVYCKKSSPNVLFAAGLAIYTRILHTWSDLCFNLIKFLTSSQHKIDSMWGLRRDIFICDQFSSDAFSVITYHHSCLIPEVLSFNPTILLHCIITSS